MRRVGEAIARLSAPSPAVVESGDAALVILHGAVGPPALGDDAGVREHQGHEAEQRYE
jgi:hypothetical protein